MCTRAVLAGGVGGINCKGLVGECDLGTGIGLIDVEIRRWGAGLRMFAGVL